MKYSGLNVDLIIQVYNVPGRQGVGGEKLRNPEGFWCHYKESGCNLQATRQGEAFKRENDRASLVH